MIPQIGNWALFRLAKLSDKVKMVLVTLKASMKTFQVRYFYFEVYFYAFIVQNLVIA